jgi:sec-independent protein translocase protein TatB
MFGLSFTELIIIAILALVLLGPERLPDAAKTLGKGLRELKRATDELKDQIETELDLEGRAAARPALVPPVPVARPSAPPPVASAENVPGLEAALVELDPPATAPAPAPGLASPDASPAPGADPAGSARA